MLIKQITTLTLTQKEGKHLQNVANSLEDTLCGGMNCRSTDCEKCPLREIAILLDKAREKLGKIICEAEVK